MGFKEYIQEKIDDVKASIEREKQIKAAENKAYREQRLKEAAKIGKAKAINETKRRIESAAKPFSFSLPETDMFNLPKQSNKRGIL